MVDPPLDSGASAFRSIKSSRAESCAAVGHGTVQLGPIFINSPLKHVTPAFVEPKGDRAATLGVDCLASDEHGLDLKQTRE